MELTILIQFRRKHLKRFILLCSYGKQRIQFSEVNLKKETFTNIVFR